MPNATLRSVVKLDTLQVKAERATTTLDATISVPSGSASGYEIVFARIPTGSRIHGTSRIFWDDLASGTSPTLGLGFKAVSGNITTSTTAMASGLALSTANLQGAIVFGDHVNSGRTVWELLGLSADPGGFVDVIGTTAAAATDITGDVTLSLAYSVD